MISIRDSKFIKSLQLKKFRNLEKQFLVEGAKNVLELLNSDLVVVKLFVTEKFMNEHRSLLSSLEDKVQEASQKELEKVGTFHSNDSAIAVVEMPEGDAGNLNDRNVLAFDSVKDPGNLGTIIRIADWYGYKEIVCSTDSVDCYNPKVISSTMGSFTRVKVFYQDLNALLKEFPNSYGAALNGEDLHEVKFKEPSLLLFGSESHGISEELLDMVNSKIRIEGLGQAESLNVAVSTAIVCDNFFRQTRS